MHCFLQRIQCNKVYLPRSFILDADKYSQKKISNNAILKCVVFTTLTTFKKSALFKKFLRRILFLINLIEIIL